MSITIHTTIPSQIKICVLIINKYGNKVLLIKEKIKKQNRPLWNVIKGTYGDHKEDIFEAAKRECQEEASVDVKLTHILGIYLVHDALKITLQWNFLAKVKKGNPKVPRGNIQKTFKEDISEIKWFDQNELSIMNPKEFVSSRIYILLQDWISGKRYPLGLYRNLSKKKKGALIKGPFNCY